MTIGMAETYYNQSARLGVTIAPVRPIGPLSRGAMNDLQVQSKPNREVVAELVITGVREALALAQGEGAALDTVTEDTFLIGQSAVLDSMGLVTAILEIEQRLADEHEIIVVLADERAMSQKNSPFRSVRSLTDYVLQQIAGQA